MYEKSPENYRQCGKYHCVGCHVDIGCFPIYFQNAKQTIEIFNPSKSNIVVEPDNENIPEYLTLTISKKILKPGEKGEIKCSLGVNLQLKREKINNGFLSK